MNNDNELMSAEEFFGEDLFDDDKGKTTVSRKPSAAGKKAETDLLNKVKVKMVMRVYGVSRTRAAEIIASRGNGNSDSKSKKKYSAAPAGVEYDMDDGADFFGD